MSYFFELLTDEPILIGTAHDSFSLKDDFGPYLRELTSLLDSANQPICYISDVRNLKIDVFQDFLVATSKGFRGQQTPARHPNLLENIVVSTDILMKLAVKGLGSDTFGSVSIPVFENMEDALAHARMLIAQEQA